MKAHFFLVLFIGSMLQKATAQIITFDKIVYALDGSCRGIIQHNNNYYMSASFTGSSSSMYVLDSLGNLQNAKLYPNLKPIDCYDFLYNTKWLNNKFYLVGSATYDTIINGNIETKQYGQVIIADTNLHETKRISVKLDSLFWGITYTTALPDLDNNMMYFGRGPRAIGNKISSALLISKYKDDGTLVFHKMDTTREVYYKTVIPCPDNSGFYMGTGVIYDFKTQFNKHLTQYQLRKYNYNGDTLWTRQYADSIFSGYGTNDVGFTDMIVTDYDNLLLVGNTAIMKLDKNGKLIWQRLDLRGGKIVKLKYADEYIVQDLFGEWVIKLDNNGNVIWKRDYRKDYLGLFYAIGGLSATEDGGFIMCIQENGQWRMVKTDCDGNVVNPIRCAYIPNVLNEMDVLTDIVNDRIIITWSYVSDYLIIMYNSLGQCVLKNKTQGSKFLSLQLGDLPIGVYYIKALDAQTQQTFTKKIVKHWN